MQSPLSAAPSAEAQLLTLETAYRRCLAYVTRVEDIFAKSHSGRPPQIQRQEDFNAIINIASPWYESMSLGEAPAATRQPITHYDFALTLFRSLIERTLPVPEQLQPHHGALWDALLGRLFYNPPAREFEFRLARLAGIPEDIKFVGALNLVASVAELAQSVRARECASPERNKGCKDAFANPCSRLQRLSQNWQDRGISDLTFRPALSEYLLRASRVTYEFPGQNPGIKCHFI